jgi:hypothetical protein
MTTEAQREQAERRETMLQDADLRRRREQQGSTFLDHTHIDDDGGRFAVVNRATIVSAEPTPASQYPAASSPWADPQPGVEPPLGIDINWMPPLDPSPVSIPGEGTGDACAPSSPLDVETASPSSSTDDDGVD